MDDGKAGVSLGHATRRWLASVRSPGKMLMATVAGLRLMPETDVLVGAMSNSPPILVDCRSGKSSFPPEDVASGLRGPLMHATESGGALEL